MELAARPIGLAVATRNGSALSTLTRIRALSIGSTEKILCSETRFSFDSPAVTLFEIDVWLLAHRPEARTRLNASH